MPGTPSAMRRAEKARRSGARVWSLEVLGRRITVTEWLNDPETAASRNSGRVCFYYSTGGTPTAARRRNSLERAGLERDLLPLALAAAGAPGVCKGPPPQECWLPVRLLAGVRGLRAERAEEGTARRGIESLTKWPREKNATPHKKT